MMRLQQTLTQCIRTLTITLLATTVVMANNPKGILSQRTQGGFAQQKWVQLNQLANHPFHVNSASSSLSKSNLLSPSANNLLEEVWGTFNCSGGLLTNPEFEQDFVGWNFYNNSTIVTDAWSGNKAAQTASTTSGGGVGQQLVAYEGQVYSLSIYAKKATSADVSVGIKYYDSAWNELSAVYLPVTSASYELYQLSAKAPEGTAYVQAMTWKEAGAGTATFDAFCFEKWEVNIPVCNGSEVRCEITPSWGNYVWAMEDGGEWKDFDDGGLFLCDNGDGTLSLKGNIINGHDSDWDPGMAIKCGSLDGWELDITLSDPISWSEFQGNWVQNNGCGDNHFDWDYWNMQGALTGIGCNTGRTIYIQSPASGYRLQVGWGGNSQSCDFGMSTWMAATENGLPVGCDLYVHIDADCYNDTKPEDCVDGVDNDNDGLIDCYDSDCAPQILQNQSFENVSGINFNTSFEGNPAVALENGATIMPNWNMAYACGGTCYDSYLIDDTQDLVNNPKGDYFLWFPGSSYCASQEIAVDIDKCYEITMTVAAWSVPDPQLKTNVKLEIFGGGIDNGNGGLLTIFEDEIPASPNWQNLNWKTLKYTWTATATTNTYFYISQDNATSNARGIVFDEVLVKEICCGGGTTPEISCEDGRDVELNFVGINNDVPNTLFLSDVSNMDSVVVEVVYKGGNPGSSIEVEDDGGNLYAANLQNVGSNAYVYRMVLPATGSVTYSNTSSVSNAQSLSAFVFRNNQPGKTVVNEFTTMGGYNGTYTLDFDIPKDVRKRNVKLVLPISEVTWDNRSLDFVATAGSVSVSESRTWGPGNEGFPNGCCIDTVEFLLKDVEPDVDLVTVDVISPSSNGQSFVIAATIGVEIFCEEICGNGIDDDGDGYVDNEDQDCLCPVITTPQSQDTTICEGDAITFEVHSNVPNPPYGYIEFYRFDTPQTNPYISGDAKVWLGEFDNDNNGTGFLTSSNFPNATASDEVYYVYGCVKPEPQDPTTCFPFVEYVVTVQNAPTANAGGDATVCSGVGHNLSASTSGGVGPYTYVWDNGLGAGESHTVNPLTTTTYTLTVTGGSSCSDTDDVTITVNQSPSVDAGEDVSICIPDATTLTATGSGVIAPSTFQWSNGLGTGDTKVVSPSATTNYSVTLTSGNGCNAIDQVTVTVSNCVEDCTDGLDNDGDGFIDCLDDDCKPDAYAGMDVSICLGTSTNIEASVTNGNGSYTYAWDNGLGSGAQKTVSPSATTVYTVSITNQTGCVGTASVTVTVNNCPEDCTDGVDNDGDGLVDCDDPDCVATAAPQLAPDDFTTCPSVPLVDRVTYNDGNLQDPTFSIVTYPSYGSITIDGTGKFTYTPLTTDCGTDSFVYEVCNQPSGCCATALVNLTIGDTDSPVLINIPSDVTISCDESVPDPSQVLAYDVCPGIFIDFEEVTNEFVVGACETYTITRTWQAEDLCGNTASGQQLITVEDLEAPELFRVYTLANGKKVVAGISPRASNNWKYVKFPISFETEPMVFSQTITNNEISAVSVQQRYVSAQGFEMRLKEEEGAPQFGQHEIEQVAWLAIESGTVSGMMDAQKILSVTDAIQALAFTENYGAAPLFFSAPQTVNETDPISIRWENGSASSLNLFLQEETSKDSETTHTSEAVSFMTINASENLLDEDGFEFGETGNLSLTNAWATVNLTSEYTKPVVIMGTPSNNDGEAVTVRVRNVTQTSFEVRLQEWDSQDGAHASETVAYMVVEGSLPVDPDNYCNPDGLAFELGENVYFRDNCDDQIAIDYTESSTMQPDGMEVTRTWIGIDDCGSTVAYSRTDDCTVAALKVNSLLYGPFINNGGGNLMRDNLRFKGYLPTSEPFTALSGFNHKGRGGDEVVGSSRFDITGDDAIVDWLFLEIHDADNPGEVLSTTSVLLKRDGSIESVDGSEIIYFPNLKEGTYFVALRHRNHIGLITKQSWYLSSTNIPTIDFSDLTVEVEGSVYAGRIINNKRSMWAGDLNGDRRVIYQGPYNDVFFLFSRVLSDSGNSQFLANFIATGYDRNDLNMDGNIIYQGPGNDRALILYHTILAHKLNSSYLANFMVIEYLP